MALADRLQEASEAMLNAPSRLEKELAKLSAEDMRVLIAAAQDESWSNVRLREVLHREGVNIPKDAFAKWRKNVTGR